MLESFLPELALPENSQLLGQLESMITERRLPHAIIIEGADGELNGRLARLCARAFLCSCERPLEGECRVCRLMATYGAHADIVKVEGSGKTGAIPVDTIRDLNEQARRIPADADGQVYLLEDCDNMQPPAQNAFLKLFEEPPPRVMFVVTCRSAMNLLETIRSRACLLRASWPGAAPDEDAVRAAELAGRFAVALVSASEADALMLTGTFSRPAAKNPQVRKELAALLSAMRSLLRDALVIGAGAPSDTENGPAAVIAGTLPPERVAAMLDELPALEQALRTNAPIPLFTTAMCVRLRRAAGR
ncbi:MAG: hypothetical protein E7554_10370 [Ruminococcaceae bacterium]|nr:hypothetical protein [Oscillospiraceae bacterium]